MNNHRCTSQKSLITIRKWLLEAGDGPSSSMYLSSSKVNSNIQLKSHLNKTMKRKRCHNQIYHSKTASIIDWFYEFISKIFTVYEENPLTYEKQLSHHVNDDTPISMITCSTCQLENVDPQNHTIDSISETNKFNLVSPVEFNSKKMITIATSSSNLNTPLQSTILHSSKSTQTYAKENEPPSAVQPLYCFTMKDGRILPIMPLLPSLSTVIPNVKEFSFSSSLFSTNNKKSECCKVSPTILSIPSQTSDIYSHFSYQSTVGSISRSDSNTISSETIPHLIDNDNILSNIPRLSSLDDTRNCLIECYPSSNFPQSSNNPSEIIFAESTCQLIKQAWLSSASGQQVHF